MRRPFCVAMTGGVGAGKSLAAQRFATLGADVVDTDEISRELTSPGGRAMDAIVAAFGESVRSADGGLDRGRMRRLAFSDPDARLRLESILHPLIREVAAAMLQASNADYVLLVVPLLLETGGGDQWLADRILVVDCEEAQQVERASSRAGMDSETVAQIMASQTARAERLAKADDIIDNTGSIAGLNRQIDALHEKYLRLAMENCP
jgi:dephospho-CoA kinase